MKKPAPPPADDADDAADFGPNTKRIEVVALELSCDLSDAEAAERATELVDELGRRARTVEVHKERKATMRAELSDHDTKIERLRAQASTKSETRAVPCDVVFFFDDGVAKTIRRDTGKIVKTRPLESHERQTTAFDDDPGEGLAQAFEAGQIAGREGKDDNPYPEGTPLAAEWDRGRRSVSSASKAPKPKAKGKASKSKPGAPAPAPVAKDGPEPDLAPAPAPSEVPAAPSAPPPAEG